MKVTHLIATVAIAASFTACDTDNRPGDTMRDNDTTPTATPDPAARGGVGTGSNPSGTGTQTPGTGTTTPNPGTQGTTPP